MNEIYTDVIEYQQYIIKQFSRFIVGCNLEITLTCLFSVVMHFFTGHLIHNEVYLPLAGR